MSDRLPLIERIKFLDHVKVHLVQHVGTDAQVVAAARVSTQGLESLDYLDGGEGEGKGLINFLMRNRHGTPFEHNMFTFYVSAPIFVFREFHRHRIGWSYNEESGRYKELDPVFYVPNVHRNLIQVGKVGEYNFVPGDPRLSHWLQNDMKEDCLYLYKKYEERLDRGIAKEVARMTLPVNIYSSMYATCNARSLMAFLSLRTNREDAAFPSKPQREIEMVADAFEFKFKELMPIVSEAFEQHGRVCP
jgi:thymidylate synthase (FAD)